MSDSAQRSPIPIRFLDGPAIRQCLSLRDCTDLMEEAMQQVSLGEAELPLRHGMPLPGGGKALGMMPGYLAARGTRPALFGIKLVSLFSANPAVGLPSHMGLYVLYEADHGRPIALLDADVITSIRTAACSAMATRVLANSNAEHLVIIGTGTQARVHAQALSRVMNFRQITICGRSEQKAVLLAEELGEELGLSVNACSDVSTAVLDADVVCTVTASREPVLLGEWLPEGVHLNLVGASFPNAREVDTAAILDSRYFVDYRNSALNQAGELIHAISSAELDEKHIVGEIGDVLLGRVPGRQSPQERTIYRSLGVAAQDIAAAWHAFQQSEKMGIGSRLEF